MKKHLASCCMIMALCLAVGCGKSNTPSSQSGSSAALPEANSNPPASGTAPDSSSAQNSSPSQPDPGLSPNGVRGQSTPPSGTSSNGPAMGGIQSPEQGQMQAQAPAPPPPPPPPIVVPAGTAIPVILSTTLNSRTNNAGDEFEGTLASAVMVNGQVAIPKGSSVTGTVVNTKAQGKLKGEAILTVKVTRINVRGKGYLVATRPYTETEKGKGKRTAVVTGGGAVLGALIGGLAGGGKGAAIGAGVGGGGGLAASAGTGGKNVTLAAESRVTFRLAESLTLDPPTN